MLHLGTPMTGFLHHFGDSGSGPVAVLPPSLREQPGTVCQGTERAGCSLRAAEPGATPAQAVPSPARTQSLTTWKLSFPEQGPSAAPDEAR